jgi:threonine dehydratase
MFERARALIDGSLVASVDEVAAAVRLIAERNRVIAEGAGACPVACALSGRPAAARSCASCRAATSTCTNCATFGQQSLGAKT